MVCPLRPTSITSTNPSEFFTSEKSPVSGRFVLSFDAVLNPMFRGILDISLVNAQGDGYGVEAVFIGPDDVLDAERIIRPYGKKQYRITLGKAVNSLFAVDKGKKRVLASAKGESARFRSIPEGEQRVPIRLERSDDGVLTLLRASLTGYEQLARAQVLDGHDAWAPMALVDGKLLLRDSKRLICLDLSARANTQ